MRRTFRKLVRDRRGATAIEYAFILTMIALAAMAAMHGVGTATSKLWQNISSQMPAAGV